MTDTPNTHECIDSHKVRKVYKRANTTVTVKSIFSDDEPLVELLFRAIQRKLQDTYATDTSKLK